MLEGLPEDLLVNVLSRLDNNNGDHNNNNQLEIAFRAIPCVCRSWRDAISLKRVRFWNLLLQREGRLVGIGRGGSGGGSNSTMIIRTRRRSINNPKVSFFKRRREIREAHRQEMDRLVYRLVHRLKKNDCIAYLRKQLQAGTPSSLPSSSVVVYHRVTELEHRTLLHYACWYGRIKTVKFLLEEYYDSSDTTNATANNSIWQVDDSNASPLLIASWAGQANVVRILLTKWKITSSNNIKSSNANNPLDLMGVPPLTSSCGGKGPKTALTWAKRKGHHKVVQLLLEQQEQQE